MIIGEYPCCKKELWIKLPDCELPAFEKEICPHCDEVVWHYLSRVNPESYTEEQFKQEWIVDETTKQIRKLKGD